ncbi:lysophospholipid acyltransferase family protein [Candidatus Omnitrophota bacterium]
MSLYQFSVACCSILLKLFIRFQMYGQENISRSGGFILASNHQSLLDPVMLGVVAKREISYMVKKRAL